MSGAPTPERTPQHAVIEEIMAAISLRSLDLASMERALDAYRDEIRREAIAEMPCQHQLRCFMGRSCGGCPSPDHAGMIPCCTCIARKEIADARP